MWPNTTQEGSIYPSSKLWEGLSKGASFLFWLSSLPKIMNIPDIHQDWKRSSSWSFKARFHPKASKNRNQDAFVDLNTPLLQYLIYSSQILRAKFWVPIKQPLHHYTFQGIVLISKPHFDGFKILQVYFKLCFWKAQYTDICQKH